MRTRSAAKTVMLAAAQLITLVVTVVALRGSLSPDRTPHSPILGSAAPLVVYAAAIVAAVLILGAAQRYRRAVRRPKADAPTRGQRRWWTVGRVVLALAALAVGIAVLLNVLPHRTAVPPQLAAPQSTEPSAPVTPTVAPPTAAPPAPSEFPAGDLLPASFVVLPILLALLAAGAVVARRRADAPDDPPMSASWGAPDPLARATELGLRAVSAHDLSPGEAIVACYAAMEHALAETPDVAPHTSDTPTEVLARAVEHGALRPESAATLVELFAEARFSRHAITEVQRQVAAEALQRVLEELRSQACVPSL